MKDRSIRCALWLKNENITTGDIIAMSTNNRLDDYIPLLATFYLGAIYNPWQHEFTLGKKIIIFDSHVKINFNNIFKNKLLKN